MEWDDVTGRGPSERGVDRDDWREPRSEWREPRADGREPRADWREPKAEARPGRRGLDERLEGWVSRGRELVDGVSGTRPGSRPPGRPGERPSGGRGRLDGLGRWVAGRLDWVLDDRDDWREPWQEGSAPAPEPPMGAPPSQGRARRPLEAKSRRPAAAPRRAEGPPLPAARAESPFPPETGARAEGEASARPPAAPMGGSASHSDGPRTTADPHDWPEPDAFQVNRWRRDVSPPPPTNPLAPPDPPPAPGRPLPRSTRRR